MNIYIILQQSAENSGSSTSSSGSNYGTLGRGQSGMASMMDEMAKTLARRRAAAEKKDPVDTPQQVSWFWKICSVLRCIILSKTFKNKLFLVQSIGLFGHVQ